jgi:predicted exporter
MPDAVVLDIKAEVDHLYVGYLQRAQRMAALGLAAIIVLLAFSLRSPKRLVRALVPLTAAVLVAAALHTLAGTRLSLLHLVGLLLVVAIGSNYVLFFDRINGPHGATANGAHDTLASLALANVTTVASFGILAWSDIPVLNAIGSTAAVGAFCTLAFAAMLSRPSDAHARRHQPVG